MPKPTPTLIATNTIRKAQFVVPLYIRVTPEGTIQALSRLYRKRADYTFHLTLEYPTYQEELQFKQLATRYDRNDHVHFIDTDFLQELRIQRCLKGWDLHEVLPDLGVDKLHSISGKLDDNSMAMWKELPPLLRKAISDTLYHYVGAP